jgi:pimeloyl-ACP methyl ester carboxylesterase
LLFFFQEKILFYPDKLAKNYQFHFNQPFQEINISTSDKKTLSGILFKADSSKGLIFYLHGNAGALNTWGSVAKIYTDLHYDVYMLDYRGYGKSEGSISNEKQFFEDAQTAYDSLKKRYDENKIVMLGYSMGTGIATKIAATNHPKLLILQAPYYSMTDMMKHTFPLIPTFILKYKLQTNEYITKCKMPIVIFHGNADEVIYYGSSLKLKKLLKQTDTLITLNGQGHDGITGNPYYEMNIKRILSQ